jgi:citrate synthase
MYLNGGRPKKYSETGPSVRDRSPGAAAAAGGRGGGFAMDEACTPTVNTGLRGVTVASTRISDVDGRAGKLIYRGYLVKDLAQSAGYEEIAHLLLYEQLPTAAELADFRDRLSRYRQMPQGVVEALKTRPRDARPMDILQAGISLLASHDPEIAEDTPEAYRRIAERLVARVPGLIAAWQRIRQGEAPVAPTDDLDHAGNFLYMLTGTRPDAEVTRFMDVCLVLHAEHSFNASTFSARQVASTRAHMYAACSAAAGSLAGPLHGGANERVMEMLQEIGSPENVEAFVNRELDSGGLIYGLGHAVYKTDDPRALILAPMARRMGELTGQPRWIDIAERLEKVGKAVFKNKKGVDIFVNVDFYSAPLYFTMGIPVDMFTPVFAVSRIAGWTAHVIEERFAEAAPKPTLYRPESQYVGDYCGPEECAFVPMDDR